MFCVHGQVRCAVVRCKQRGMLSATETRRWAIELARQVAELFGCDGLGEYAGPL